MGVIEILEVVGLALVVAANPLPVLGQLTLVHRPDGLRVATSFAAGWAAAVLLLVTALSAGAAALFAAYLPGPAGADAMDGGDGSPVAAVIIGLALFVLGLVLWLRSPRDAGGPPSRLTRTFQGLTPARAVLLGAALAVLKPKTLVAVAAASGVIGAEGRLLGSSAVLLVLFTLVASAAVGSPVVLRAVGGTRVVAALGRLQGALARHTRRITGGLMAAIGAIILIAGLVA